MSYLQELTELYKVQQRNQDQDMLTNGSLRAHLEAKSLDDFCNAIFVYGYEARDDESIPYDYVKRALELIISVYEIKKKESPLNDDMLVRYSLGLCGLRLANCQRSDITPERIHSTELEEMLNNIREVFCILNSTQHLAKGILSYQHKMYYDYAYDCMSHLTVSNNNRPPDLDSVYVFMDAIDDDSIWIELARQLRNKYPRDMKVASVQEYHNLALRELSESLNKLEQQISEENTVEIVDD